MNTDFEYVLVFQRPTEFLHMKNIMIDRPDIRGKLVGVPARIAAKPKSFGTRHHGWIKLRLCHAPGRSYLLPDILIGFNGTRFFLPSFFGPPKLLLDTKIVRTQPHQAEFTLDVAAPRSSIAVRLLVKIFSDGHVRTYEDGSQLYRCTYVGPERVPLKPHIAGQCKQIADGDFALELFHHTTPERAAMILDSGELWSGSCNLAGTAKLENVSHVYFTTLPRINDDEDLRRIAMSPKGILSYQTTSDLYVEKQLHLSVYISNVKDRISSLSFSIPLSYIAPAHLLFHPMVWPNPAYYEVIGPEIIRIAVHPGEKIKFDHGQIILKKDQIKYFNYIVEGDASTTKGLSNPMIENTTSEISHIQKLDLSLDLFDFWIKNANTNLFSGRNIEPRKLRLLTS